MEAKAKDTTAALRRHVLPLLREAGFDDVAGRKLWRHRGERIDHIELGSFSSYMAQSMRCPTASLSVRLGLALPGYGATDDPFHRDHVKDGPKGPRPKESQMPIRGVLCPPDAPPLTQGRWGWEYRWVWPIATTEDAEAAAVALARQFRDYALDWLTRDWDLEAILALLQSRENRLHLVTADNGSHLFLNAELPGSQIRAAHVSMVTKAMARRRRPI